MLWGCPSFILILTCFPREMLPGCVFNVIPTGFLSPKYPVWAVELTPWAEAEGQGKQTGIELRMRSPPGCCRGLQPCSRPEDAAWLWLSPWLGWGCFGGILYKVHVGTRCTLPCIPQIPSAEAAAASGRLQPQSCRNVD